MQCMYCVRMYIFILLLAGSAWTRVFARYPGWENVVMPGKWRGGGGVWRWDIHSSSVRSRAVGPGEMHLHHGEFPRVNIVLPRLNQGFRVGCMGEVAGVPPAEHAIKTGVREGVVDWQRNARSFSPVGLLLAHLRNSKAYYLFLRT
jgi:hypothetical protein